MSIDLRAASLGFLPNAAYLYNALGQQVSRDVGGVVTLSMHDLNGDRIAEHDGSGVVLREYIWLDGRPLAVVEGGQVYQLHWDHIGRPEMATDSTGNVVWAASYLPFGGIDQVYVDTLALEQTLRFPGQWFQAETGLHQNWMRDYDPTTGRYLQADPLGLVDGPSVYGYARQSPMRYTDPRGEFIPILIGIGVGFALGEIIDHVQEYCTCGGNELDDGVILGAIGGGFGATGPFVQKPRAGLAGGGKAKQFTSVLSEAVLNSGGGTAGTAGAAVRAGGRIASRVLPGLGLVLTAYDLLGLLECLE